jgi:hypothetical protein
MADNQKYKTASAQKSKPVTATTLEPDYNNEEGEGEEEEENLDEYNHDLAGFTVEKRAPNATEKQSSLAALRSHFITFTERAKSIKTGKRTTHTSSHCKYCQINFERLLQKTPEVEQKKARWMEHYQPRTIANYRRNLILHLKRCGHFQKAVPHEESKLLINRNMQALGMETSPSISALTEQTSSSKAFIKKKGWGNKCWIIDNARSDGQTCLPSNQ